MILDTCALIWLVNGGGELSQGALNAVSRAKAVYLSAASAIEIGCKHRLGALLLPMDPARWYEEALARHDLIELPIDGRIGLCSASLPMIHKDPADRIIIATALQLKLPVVTHDKRFPEYGVTVIR